jgi:GLPGLI family protein
MQYNYLANLVRLFITFKPMKKIFKSVAVLSSLLWVLNANAQKRITEGTISYDIVVNTGNSNPSIADMFNGATSIVYLKGYQTRFERVSSLGVESTIVDGKTGNVNVLKEYGEQKYMITMTPDNWKEANKKYEGIVFKYEEEYKTIAEYKCQKAIGTMKDGTTITVYFTKDLVANNREFEYAYKSLPGLAMEYETIIGSLKVTYTVSKVNFSIVPATKFELPKSGFRVMTYEESNNAGKTN